MSRKACGKQAQKPDQPYNLHLVLLIKEVGKSRTKGPPETFPRGALPITRKRAGYFPRADQRENDARPELSSDNSPNRGSVDELSRNNSLNRGSLDELSRNNGLNRGSVDELSRNNGLNRGSVDELSRSNGLNRG